MCNCPCSSVSLHGLPPDVSASLLSYAKAGGLPGGMPGDMGAAVQQLMAAAAAQSSRRSLDSAAAALKRLENPAIANARAGPRLFVGKLTKVGVCAGRVRTL
ncbi:hypothetical protein DUNSADRAFT_4686 [Dunaliella salina]|uniref:Encoded protein n=1 Tax=Dunaliella salina TaxID=3046 RepID=A0ABQ7FUP6_DUNSA|nr:hypothetical protein DUNSADRAFT_4686 [Dunaliella salina]|eukprot:KAF5826126.1 hypothetical protein DUNSADRAFT_4686 [Dunaliella salina]